MPRPSPEAPRRSPLRDRRTRIALAGGLLALPLVAGTSAAWVDSATVGGTPLTSGTIDLRLDGADSLTSTSLAMPAMVPGSHAAQVVSVGNAGTVPLRWSMAGRLGGADAAAYGAASAIRVVVVPGGSRATTAGGAGCTGGTRLAAVALTTGSQQVAPLGATLAVGASESVCLEVALADDAPSTLQGKAATLMLVATGTTDVG